ncbi:hypothetical protein OAQ99_03340 [Candidatus Kapabacteria bacterium]|nr:hypothetical protein [Candidatus Kapabacteria bacterium]
MKVLFVIALTLITSCSNFYQLGYKADYNCVKCDNNRDFKINIFRNQHNLFLEFTNETSKTIKFNMRNISYMINDVVQNGNGTKVDPYIKHKSEIHTDKTINDEITISNLSSISYIPQFNNNSNNKVKVINPIAITGNAFSVSESMGTEFSQGITIGTIETIKDYILIPSNKKYYVQIDNLIYDLLSTLPYDGIKISRYDGKLVYNLKNKFTNFSGTKIEYYFSYQVAEIEKEMIVEIMLENVELLVKKRKSR